MQAIDQGECTDCGESDDNYSVVTRDFKKRAIECDCGAMAAIVLTEEGIVTSGEISHEDASWVEDENDEQT